MSEEEGKPVEPWIEAAFAHSSTLESAFTSGRRGFGPGEFSLGALLAAGGCRH
jgi:hypothetical protein